MLAVLAAELPPEDGSWAYELKWDGVRAVVYLDRQSRRAMSRNRIDMMGSYPELAELALPHGTGSLVLDGEIVALGDDGRPSFELLQSRMHVGDPARAARLAKATPVTFMAFDVLDHDGTSLLKQPYHHRRQVLLGLGLENATCRVPPHWTDHGDLVLAAAREQQLEGVLCKQLDSLYYPGRRFNGWLKVKNLRAQEVVIGGWQPGEGRRRGTIGALLLGLPEGEGLRYVGKVGTGFTDRSLTELGAMLAEVEQPASPFVEDPPRRDAVDAVWVAPTVVGEVRFSEWTRDGRLRHPAWRGLRPDKQVAQVVRES